ncbi:hypothetical protein ACMFMG_003664 [Clarireedia jacksonii]
MPTHSSKSQNFASHQKADKSQKHPRAPSSTSSDRSSTRHEHPKKERHQKTQSPQPETWPISQEQLDAQSTTIHIGLLMVEAKCIKVDEKLRFAASHTPNQQWQNSGDVVDGPAIDNGFKDPAALLYTGGELRGELQREIPNQAAFSADVDMALPLASRPASGNTYQHPSDIWLVRGTWYPTDGNPDATTYPSYGQPSYTPQAVDASSGYPTTASGSGTLPDEQVQMPQHVGQMYDYTLGRWVYEDVNLEAPVRHRDEKLQ